MKKECITNKNLKGFSVVEIMLSITIFTFLALGIGSMLAYVSQTNANSGDKDKALFLAQEGMEALVSIRNDSYANLTNGTYGLDIVSNRWEFAAQPDITSGYTRQVNINQIDSYQKEVEVNVSWVNKFGNTQEIKMTRVLADINRQLILDASWVNAIKTYVLDLLGNDDGLKIDVQGNFAYVLRANNRKLEIIDISDKTAMQSVSFINFDGTPIAIDVEGDFAYIATDDNAGELVVVDISNQSTPTIAGTFNVTIGSAPLDIAYYGNHAYLVFANSNKADELFAVDVTNPASMSLSDSINVASGANRIAVDNNYAFVTSPSNNSELQIFSISTPTNIQLSTSLNLAGNQDGLYVNLNQNLLAIYRKNQNVNLIDITNPLAPVEIGIYTPTNQIVGVKINASNDLLFILSARSGQQLDVVDIQNISSPTRLILLDTISIINDLYYNEVSDIVFAVGVNDLEEIIVIEPQ